jgi:hypothetical protein
MTVFNLSINSGVLSKFQQALAAFGRGHFPATAAAMGYGARYIAERWRDFAKGGALAGAASLRKPNREYLEGVKVKRLGAFSYEISNKSEAAKRIARGTPELDMKKTHPYGPRSRVSKEGIPYLIVPIRWGTPARKGEQRVGFKNVMPKSVYNTVKRFAFTKTVMSASGPANTKRSRNARGETAGRARYSWGGRLNSAGIPGTFEEKSRMSGMTRMQGADGKSAGYFTFRVISARKPRNWDKRGHSKPWEKSWIKPAEPARDAVPALIAASSQSVERAIEEGIRSDLSSILS